MTSHCHSASWRNSRIIRKLSRFWVSNEIATQFWFGPCAGKVMIFDHHQDPAHHHDGPENHDLAGKSWFSSRSKTSILTWGELSTGRMKPCVRSAIRTKHNVLETFGVGLDFFVECVTSCLTLNFKVKGQGHNIDIFFCEFRDIDSILIDTKHKFLRHILPEISYWMRYVTFYLEFQGQRSRSQPWYLFFWIFWHPFSNRGHAPHTSFHDIYYQR